MDTTADNFFAEFLGKERENALSDRSGSSEALTEDEALVAAAAKGDDEAFRRLVERHQERVYHFCHQWLRQPEDAREACQDTFVRVYQSLNSYRNRGRFRSWLFRIALNQCRDRYRSKAARQHRDTFPLLDEEPGTACPRTAPDESARLANEVELIWRGIDQLPEKLRDVLILCAVEGMPQEEGARILGCSVRAIEGRLYRARRLLEDWWKAQAR